MKRILIAAMILGCLMTGCTAPKQAETDAAPEPAVTEAPDGSESERKMLLDYFRRTVGTPMEMPYYELVIYTYDSEHLLLEQYQEGGTPYETVRGFLIPSDAYENVLEIVRKHRMEKWNDTKENVAITGALYVCRFCLDGTYYRVSSENMPENGISAFDEVGSAMAAYMDEDRLIYDRYTREPPEEPEGTLVRDRDELLSYARTVELDGENWKEYFELTSGMGSTKEDGFLSDHVLFYVLLYGREGYFPGRDFRLAFLYTAVREESRSEETGEAGPDSRWQVDPFDGRCWTRPAVFDEFTAFEDLRVTEAGGEVVCFDIPEEMVMEDEFGRYFCFGSLDTRYYLDGFTGQVLHVMMTEEEIVDVDYRNLWFEEILSN